MNAVVLTVKASYVASTKYRKHHQNDEAIVTWKMKVGELCRNRIKIFSLLVDRENTS